MTVNILMAWIDAHYQLAPTPEDGSAPGHRCIRCGAEVEWLTKHAVERHGDTDIEVLEPVKPAPEGGWKW